MKLSRKQTYLSRRDRTRRRTLGRAPIKLIVALAVIALVVIVPYVVSDSETKEMNEAARAGVAGEFIELTDGVVHYEVAGPEGAPTVVFIHGFSTPYFTWDECFAAVTEAGYRAVRLDLFGRGYSDRPSGVDYDADLYDRQVVELLDKLDITGPVTLAGLSMGGAVSILFADHHPARVNALILVDPAGFPLPMPTTAKLIRIPMVGEYLMRLMGDKTILEGNAGNFYDQSLLPEFNAKFEVQMEYKGFKSALLSTLRHMRLQDLGAEYALVGESGVPTLLVWGKEDTVIPFETSEKVMAAIPQAELVAVEEGAHTPNYENPDIVNPAMLDFLGRVAPIEK